LGAGAGEEQGRNRGGTGEEQGDGSSVSNQRLTQKNRPRPLKKSDKNIKSIPTYSIIKSAQQNKTNRGNTFYVS